MTKYRCVAAIVMYIMIHSASPVEAQVTCTYEKPGFLLGGDYPLPSILKVPWTCDDFLGFTLEMPEHGVASINEQYYYKKSDTPQFVQFIYNYLTNEKWQLYKQKNVFVNQTTKTSLFLPQEVNKYKKTAPWNASRTAYLTIAPISYKDIGNRYLYDKNNVVGMYNYDEETALMNKNGVKSSVATLGSFDEVVPELKKVEPKVKVVPELKKVEPKVKVTEAKLFNKTYDYRAVGPGDMCEFLLSQKSIRRNVTNLFFMQYEERTGIIGSYTENQYNTVISNSYFSNDVPPAVYTSSDKGNDYSSGKVKNESQVLSNLIYSVKKANVVGIKTPVIDGVKYFSFYSVGDGTLNNLYLVYSGFIFKTKEGLVFRCPRKLLAKD